jgi:hypothetical protein
LPTKRITINELATFRNYLIKKNSLSAFPVKESTEKNYHQANKNVVMSMGNVVVPILYLEGNVKKNDANDRKPEQSPEHLKFFHFNTVYIVTWYDQHTISDFWQF